MVAENDEVKLNDAVFAKDEPAPNMIHVLRYIRPTVDDGLPDNMYGITISYIMDYDNRKVYAQWAICNGEQFSRKVGTVVALLSRYVRFDMELVDRAKGLNNALKAVLISVLLGSDDELIGDDYISNHALFKLGKDTLSKDGNLDVSLAEE